MIKINDAIIPFHTFSFHNALSFSFRLSSIDFSLNAIYVITERIFSFIFILSFEWSTLFYLLLFDISYNVCLHEYFHYFHSSNSEQKFIMKRLTLFRGVFYFIRPFDILFYERFSQNLGLAKRVYKSLHLW